MESEGVRVRPARDERGRLLPGSGGTPRGRPKDGPSARPFAQAAGLGVAVLILPQAAAGGEPAPSTPPAVPTRPTTFQAENAALPRIGRPSHGNRGSFLANDRSGPGWRVALLATGRTGCTHSHDGE
jgi:hypothetical protein